MSATNQDSLLFFIAAIALVIYYLFSKNKSAQQRHQDMKKATRYISELKPISLNAKWYTRNDPVDVANFTIRHGFIYVGEHLLDDFGIPILEDDASFINPKLDILQPRSIFRKVPHKIISYAKLTPEERGTYLHWLTTARSEPEIDSGFAVLFLYGIEHRLIIDDQDIGISQDERFDMANEIKRLIMLYPKDETLQRVAYNLLILLWAQDEQISPPFEHMQQHCKQFVSILVNSMSLILAKYATDAKPLPVIVASAWALSHSGYTPEQRQEVAEDIAFVNHFHQFYVDLFKNGLILNSVNKNSESYIDHAHYKLVSPTSRKEIPLKHPILFMATGTERPLALLQQVIVCYYDPDAALPSLDFLEAELERKVAEKNDLSVSVTEENLRLQDIAKIKSQLKSFRLYLGELNIDEAQTQTQASSVKPSIQNNRASSALNKKKITTKSEQLTSDESTKMTLLLKDKPHLQKFLRNLYVTKACSESEFNNYCRDIIMLEPSKLNELNEWSVIQNEGYDLKQSAQLLQEHSVFNS